MESEYQENSFIYYTKLIRYIFISENHLSSSKNLDIQDVVIHRDEDKYNLFPRNRVSYRIHITKLQILYIAYISLIRFNISKHTHIH